MRRDGSVAHQTTVHNIDISHHW